MLKFGSYEQHEHNYKINVQCVPPLGVNNFRTMFGNRVECGDILWEFIPCLGRSDVLKFVNSLFNVIEEMLTSKMNRAQSNQ